MKFTQRMWGANMENTIFNQDLTRLKKGILQKKKLETELSDLYVQKKDLMIKRDSLEEIKNSEQRDVERLEGGSLAAFFYNVIGKKEEKLSKEKEEAYKAAVKYDAALEELYSVEQEINRREELLRPLANCETEYKRAFEEALKQIRTGATTITEEILAIEASMYEIECEKKEINEALTSGRRALNLVDSVLGELDSADGWATWDLLGGGLISDMAKHEHLDNAQRKINSLQVQLREFKTELADVRIDTDIHVQIDGFMRFADYFFDGLFADLTVKDKIESSINRVKHTRNEVNAIISKLEDKLANADRRWQSKVAERENKVLGK